MQRPMTIRRARCSPDNRSCWAPSSPRSATVGRNRRVHRAVEPRLVGMESTEYRASVAAELGLVQLTRLEGYRKRRAAPGGQPTWSGRREGRNLRRSRSDSIAPIVHRSAERDVATIAGFVPPSRAVHRPKEEVGDKRSSFPGITARFGGGGGNSCKSRRRCRWYCWQTASQSFTVRCTAVSLRYVGEEIVGHEGPGWSVLDHKLDRNQDMVGALIVIANDKWAEGGFVSLHRKSIGADIRDVHFPKMRQGRV